MEQQFVRKSVRVDPSELAKARSALGAASDSEAVRIALRMVIDQEQAIAIASRIMKQHTNALRELAAPDRERGSEQDE